MIDKNDTCGYKLKRIKLATACCDFEIVIPQEYIKILALSDITEDEYFDNYGELISNKTIGDFKLVLNDKANSLKVANSNNKDLFALLMKECSDDLMSIEVTVNDNKNKTKKYKYSFVYKTLENCGISNVYQRVIYDKNEKTLTITITPNNYK